MIEITGKNLQNRTEKILFHIECVGILVGKAIEKGMKGNIGKI